MLILITTMVIQLDNDLWFPDPRLADDDGCLAVGGDLSIDRLLLAYSHGIFPWFAYQREEPIWYCPHERFVIFPQEIHVSHSMRTLIKKDTYHVTFNQDFEGVIGQCSQLRIEEEGAWLGPAMIEAYTELHRQGFAVSMETRDEDDRLVGGLYGVHIGPAFFGESMFSLAPSASKLALIAVARLMQECGGTIIDCQFETPHLRSMGGRFIDYDEYMRLITPQ